MSWYGLYNWLFCLNVSIDRVHIANNVFIVLGIELE